MAIPLMAFPVTRSARTSLTQISAEFRPPLPTIMPFLKSALVRRKELTLKVFVRDNNVDQALRILKKKLQREGLFREIKRRKAYEKPSERKAREKTEAIRRGKKAARKLAQREGLVRTPPIKRAKPGRRSV